MRQSEVNAVGDLPMREFVGRVIEAYHSNPKLYKKLAEHYPHAVQFAMANPQKHKVVEGR